MTRRIDLKGKQFGRLSVITDTKRRTSYGKALWLCRCLCGNIAERTYGCLISGRSNSCGCLQKESIIKRSFKHGGKGTKLYDVWRAIKKRCYNSHDKAYQYYGKRNIIICPEWLNNFAIFRDWAIQNGYKEGLTIDRKNSSGNYEPPNCQWITLSENVAKSNRSYPRRKRK